MALVVDASVGLKWFLPEPDSDIAAELAESGEDLLAPDFWLNEACNVLWRQVRRGGLDPEQATQGLHLLRSSIRPTPTIALQLHEMALEIGIAAGHSPYDTLYVAFALSQGAPAVVVSDAAFARAMRRHPDCRMAGLILPLSEWKSARDARE